MPHAIVLVVVLVSATVGPLWQQHGTEATRIARGAPTGATDMVVSGPEAGLPLGPTLPGGRRLGAVVPVRPAFAADYLTQPDLPTTITPQRVQLYTVQAGDSLGDIAARHNIDVPTIQWANGLPQADGALAPGQQLRIPPVKGMLHYVRQNDSLATIAATYGVSPQAITDHRPNQVRDTADLVVGQMLMVPGGKMPERTTVIMHTVAVGDTIISLADQYNVSPETIVSANSLDDPDFLQLGQQLAILPVSGVAHTVGSSDTIASLASRYAVEEEAIRSYGPNGLGAGGEIVPGQHLIVPGGRVPTPVRPTPAPAVEETIRTAQVTTRSSAPAAPAAAPAPRPIVAPAPPPAPAASATGRMSWPTTGTITTYFSSWHNGLDIANGFGTPIGAADGGVVTWAGWRTDGLGIAVFVDHGGGLQTWYGHFSSVAVVPGQRVAKGQLLGYMGSTGRSTGPHLHFMVLVNYGYRNPLNYLP